LLFQQNSSKVVSPSSSSFCSSSQLEKQEQEEQSFISLFSDRELNCDVQVKIQQILQPGIDREGRSLEVVVCGAGKERTVSCVVG
jgi:hypothetical protein